MSSRRNPEELKALTIDFKNPKKREVKHRTNKRPKKRRRLASYESETESDDAGSSSSESEAEEEITERRLRRT